MRTAAEMSTATPRSTIPPPFSLGKESTVVLDASVDVTAISRCVGPFLKEFVELNRFLFRGRAHPPYFIISVWLSLFSSEVSMLADIGRFAQASSPEN